MDIYKAREKSYEVLGKTVCKQLNSHGFKAKYLADRGTALKEALKLIPQEASVGIPGTVTVREIGLLDSLMARNSRVFHNWYPNLTKKEQNEMFMKELTSDWIVMSVNAIALDKGTLINIDGTGNRVGAMSWAPGKLLIIAGTNKIASNVNAAMARARDTATPANTIRLNLSTPCATIGHCMDCDSSDRICNVTTMLERAPTGRECHVFIVGEKLGY